MVPHLIIFSWTTAGLFSGIECKGVGDVWHPLKDLGPSLNFTVDPGNHSTADVHAQASGSPHWSYHAYSKNELSPDIWPAEFGYCGGRRQSPIAIDTKAVVVDATMQPLMAFRYDTVSRNNLWSVRNNGHAVQFSGYFITPPELFGGNLPDEYIFLQFHFHWGGTDARGSEHTIDGQRFPLELHIVHRRSIEDDEEANADNIGLAVLAVMYEISEVVNKTQTHLAHLSSMLSAIAQVDDPGESQNVTLPGFRLQDLLPDLSGPFYRYNGSLTTPPCSEVVVWTVMQQRLTITEKHVNVFRGLRLRPKGSHETDHVNDVLVDNYRPVQSTNGRTVKFFPGTLNRKGWPIRKSAAIQVPVDSATALPPPHPLKLKSEMRSSAQQSDATRYYVLQSVLIACTVAALMSV